MADNTAKVATDRHFNSHAHVERDALEIILERLIAISTHTLTWSVTSTWRVSLISASISTHTLTWSVTQRIQLFHVLSVISTHTLTWSVTINIRVK